MTTVYTVNNKVLKNSATDKWLAKKETPVDPYNPLGLPPYTIRLLYNDGATPNFTMGTGVQVSQSPNIWDLTYNNTVWEWLLEEEYDLLEVLGANTSGVTNMSYMFIHCDSLTTAPLFDTSSVTNMSRMFVHCSSLTSVPLFNTSSVTDMSQMFTDCISVETGALALYQQASTQATPPSNHDRTFRNCGRNTVTGAAELAQIPSDWGGTAQ